MIVPGHGLLAEGAPHTASSCQEWPCDKLSGVQRVNRWGALAAHGVGGHGHGVCTCGWTSTHLLSGAERRRAHAAHKAEIRGEVPAAPH